MLGLIIIHANKWGHCGKLCIVLGCSAMQPRDVPRGNNKIDNSTNMPLNGLVESNAYLPSIYKSASWPMIRINGESMKILLQTAQLWSNMAFVRFEIVLGKWYIQLLNFNSSKFHELFTKLCCTLFCESYHYNDVRMSAMASQITSLTIVCSIVYWCGY